MSSQSAPGRPIRFGLFEADLSSGELHKQGRRIKLQEQPFQVLAVLLCRPGELVTREELKESVWPSDTFIEFDQGLNTAIKKIRLALGDSADNPRFIETVPRKGYRFIAPVDSNSNLVAGTAAPQTRMRRRWPLAALAFTVMSGAAVWRFHTDGSPPEPVPVPLTSYPGDEVSPSFSPDGNYVAFAWNTSPSVGQGNFDIYVKLIGGGDPVRLTRDPADDFSPVWSPDNRYIAFLRRLSSNSSGLFLVPAIGGSERKLAEIYQADEHPPYFGPYLSWFPDAQRLVVMDKDSAGAPFALFVVSLESGEKQRLTSPPTRTEGDWNPAISPDGSAVAFSRFTTQQSSDLFLLSLAEKLAAEPKRLTSLSGVTCCPTWFAGGRELIFSSGLSYGLGLWRLPLRTNGWSSKANALAFAGQGAGQPATSRQGRLAYAQASFDVDILRLELNGDRPVTASPVKLISSTRVDHEPQYSPDGSRIVFGSNRSGSLEIWVCDSNGSNCTQLTSFGSPSYTASPRWSPDGRLIAFASTREGHVSSYVINAEGGKPKLLPIESFCGWSRDGQSIYFTSSRSGSKQLWKTTWPPPEQSAVQITKHGFIGEVMESNDGKYLFYSRTTADGSQGIWRMSLDTGDEQQILESFLNNNVALTDQGIYYIPGSQPRSICFLSFVTGKAITIARLPHDPAWGFSITPDGRSLLYSEYEAVRSDLMMVEHFR